MDSNTKRIGVIGPGLMGTAITDRLLESGYSVAIWNRTKEKADRFLQRGAIWSENPISVCDRVIISLYSSDVVAQVIDQMHDGLHPSQVIIDTTTGEPEDCRSMGQQLAALGVQYLDAPISGSSEQTRRGEVMVMVGGNPAAFEGCEDIWPVLGKSVFYTGERGSASRMKLYNEPRTWPESNSSGRRTVVRQGNRSFTRSSTGSSPGQCCIFKDDGC